MSIENFDPYRKRPPRRGEKRPSPNSVLGVPPKSITGPEKGPGTAAAVHRRYIQKQTELLREKMGGWEIAGLVALGLVAAGALGAVIGGVMKRLEAEDDLAQRTQANRAAAEAAQRRQARKARKARKQQGRKNLRDQTSTEKEEQDGI